MTVTDIRTIGSEGQAVAIVDGFAADPDCLRRAAAAARFGPAGQHYPGLRAALPPDYWAAQRPAVAAALATFGAADDLAVIDASFSIVTREPAALTLRQRLPHVDAFAPDRIAMVHYLVPGTTSGTAFFRHRSTGFETVDQDRKPCYRERLEAELRDRPRLSGYAAADMPLFERVAAVAGHYNRAIFYRSNLLHSGVIDAGVPLSADPMAGRLTVTAFFALP